MKAKPTSERVSIAMPIALKERLQRMARERTVSLSDIVREICLKSILKEHYAGKGK